MTEQLYAERFSDLVLTKGINLEEGMCLNINTFAETYYYARVMAEHAYRKGAKYVKITILDPHLDKARTLYQKDKDLTFVPNYERSFNLEAAGASWANVRIECPEGNLGLEIKDVKKMQLISNAQKEAKRELSQKYMGSQLPWCVCCVPGPKWAKKLLGPQATVEDLADVLAKILKIDNENYLKAWDKQDKLTKKRMKYLNELQIKSLHFKSSVTDFTVSFRKEAKYEGCSEKLPSGSIFFPNLPTEEIFTVPDRLTAEGYIITTRPVKVLGKDTEEVTLYFKDGKCYDVKAKKGLQAMRSLLASDEGASYLGEIALVDNNSPISKSNLVFGSILIDENASCHIALGAGYPSCLDLKDKEDPKDYGCNESIVHVDFMVGSSDMEITAETYRKKIVKIMINGQFQF